MVRRPEDDGVNVFVFEQLSVVAIKRGFETGQFTFGGPFAQNF